MAEVKQVRDPADEMFLVFVQAFVGVRDPPQFLEQTLLVLGGIRPIDRGGELVEVVGAVDVLFCEREELVAHRWIQIEQALQRSQHVASLIVRHVEIRAQDLDQERRDGQVRALDSGVRVLPSPDLEVLADEGFHRREHA